MSQYSESLDAILTASHTLSQVPQSLRQCSKLISIHNQTINTLTKSTSASSHHSTVTTTSLTQSESCHTLPIPKPRGATPQVTRRIQIGTEEVVTGAQVDSCTSLAGESDIYSSSPQLSCSGFSTLPPPRKLRSSRYSFNSHRNSRNQYSSDTLPKNFSCGLSSRRPPLTKRTSCPVPATRPNLADQLASYPETKRILQELDNFTKGTEIYRSVTYIIKPSETKSGANSGAHYPSLSLFNKFQHIWLCIILSPELFE